MTLLAFIIEVRSVIMKKKITRILISVCACLATTSLLVACDSFHQHEFSETWSYNEDVHWHDCTSIACPTQSDKALHTFKERIDRDGNKVKTCTVCGMETVSVFVPEHEHVYKTEWAGNDDYHWHDCETKNCDERGDWAQHTYGEPVVEQDGKVIRRTYTCAECEYEKIDEIEIETVVKDETSWDNAFTNLEMLNFSMEVHFPEGNVNFCTVTETSAYYHIEGGTEFYTYKNEDGTCTTYFRLRETMPFILLEDTSDTYLVGAQTETVIKISFENYYQNFVYDEEQGAYLYDDLLETTAYYFDGEPYGDQMYCFDNVVKVVDGEISYISCSYYFDDYFDYNDSESDEESDFDYREQECPWFVYYNIGMTTMVIPDEVIENAISEEEAENLGYYVPSPPNNEGEGGSSSDYSEPEYSDEYEDEFEDISSSEEFESSDTSW